MAAQSRLARLAAGLAALSVMVTPIAGQACTPVVIHDVRPKDFMKAKCQQALANPWRFLGRIQSGKVDRPELDDYVLAFDEGKYGCRENKAFVFKMLDRYYAVGDRKLTRPWLLRRYAFNMPDDHDPAAREHVYNLLWLFNDAGTYLPRWWTTQDARAFVERPEHWPLALARFGQIRDRDDAVFASVVDPQSRYFDRALALKLAEFPSTHRIQRRIQVAALYTDARFGAPNLAVAESLLPRSALYSDQSATPMQQQARTLWGQIEQGYSQSADPALRAKGQELRALMAPPVLDGWPAFDPPKDGRVWLSLADWPEAVPNPFAGTAVRSTIATPDDYPVRALREERTGLVTVAARFGPDGKFVAVETVRSSGVPSLDTATVGMVTRRFRPKLREMTITGYPGRDVMVPLLVVNWVISEDEAEVGNPGAVRFSNGMLTIVAQTRGRLSDLGHGCGYYPSNFL